MSILIKGMEMPLSCGYCPLKQFTLHTGDDCLVGAKETEYQKRPADCPIVELPAQHGRLIDADALRQSMYHEAFETDSPMQKWDSGCWIRYKMFERLEGNAPTIIEAEVSE